jgi:hypothetical protein
MALTIEEQDILVIYSLDLKTKPLLHPSQRSSRRNRLHRYAELDGRIRSLLVWRANHSTETA